MEGDTPVKKKTKKPKAAAAADSTADSTADAAEAQENGVQENGVEQDVSASDDSAPIAPPEPEGINFMGKLPEPSQGLSAEDVAIQIAMLMAQNATMLDATPEATHSLADLVHASTNRGPALAKLEDDAKQTMKLAEQEEKKRKELEIEHDKLMKEKQDLLDTINGEKGSLADLQDKTNKLASQKQSLENQLRVSKHRYF